MKILVTGGTGFIGKFAVREFLAAGHAVRALVRDRDRAAATLPVDVELAVGSAMDRQAVHTALDGCDGLFHAAGVYSYDRRDAQRMSAETPALAEAVLTAALDAHVPRVVDVATALVFTTNSDRITLSTRLAGPGDHVWGDPYARAKVVAEQTAIALEAKGLPRVTLHPTRVLGPEDSGPGTSGDSVIALMRGGLTTNARGGWVDVRDVAAAAMAGFSAPPGTHALLSASSMRYRQLAPLLDSLTGVRRRRIFAPRDFLRIMARLNDRVGGRIIEGPTAGALEYVLTSPPIDGSSGEALIRRPYLPLEETLVDAIRWWAANGTIDSKLAGKLAP